jgi:YidC/Oxa1 family membrane protein insertase
MESDQQKRLFLAMAIMIPMALIFSFLTAPRQEAPPVAIATDAGQPSAPAAAAPPSPPPAVEASPPAPPEAPAAEVKEVVVERPEVDYTFTTRGGALRSAKLKGNKGRDQTRLSVMDGLRQAFGGDVPPAPQMDMAVPPDGAELPLALAIKGPRPLPETAVYEVKQEPDALTFTTRQHGYEVEKVVRWPQGGGHDFAISFRVKNVGADRATGEVMVPYTRGVKPGDEEEGSFFGGVGNVSNAACLVNDDLVRLPPSDKPPTETKGKVSFVAIDQQYFAGAVYPIDGAQDGRCEAVASPALRRAAAYLPLSLGPGEEVTYRFGVYVGPKDVEVLEAAPDRMASLGVKPAGAAGFGESRYPHLDKLVDYGVWAAICRVLLAIMKFFHAVTSNWGVAIILLTVVVKVLLLPLSHKAMVGAEQLKKLQPKMDEIRKKFADDRERQQMEMMKLYQEAKVNPVGGCLPMLLQIPIWFALFTTLRTSYELYREPFISPLWTDLTFRDPTYLIPIAMGVSWILTQRAQPQMMDPIQAKMMTYVMPTIFTFAMLNYPMGLSLYIFTNNILTTLQQYGLKKYLARKGGGGGGGGTPASKPGDKHERDARKSSGRRERAAARGSAS